MGRKLFRSLLSFDLGRGITLACLNSLGKILRRMHRLYIWVKDSTMYGSESLIIRGLISSGPAEFLFFIFLMKLPTSCIIRGGMINGDALESLFAQKSLRGLGHEYVSLDVGVVKKVSATERK